MKSMVRFQLGKFLSGYLKLNKNWIIPAILVAVLWRAIFYCTGLLRINDSLTSGNVEKTTLLFVFLGVLLACSVLFSIGIGLSFKQRGNESWLSRLPIPDFAFTFVPYILITLYSLFLLLLAPNLWSYGAEVSAFPMIFSLGLVPISSYLTARSIKNSPAGITLGILAGFLVLGSWALFILGSIGKFGWILGAGKTYEFSFIRWELEAFCFSIILALILTTTDRKKTILSPIVFGLVISGLFCVTQYINFDNKKKEAAVFLSPLEQAVIESKGKKGQCEPFHKFVQDFVYENREKTFKTRALALKANDILKEYPEKLTELKSLIPFYEKVQPGIAEVLLIEKTFGIYGCGVIPKHDLQNALIETVSKNPGLLSRDETKQVVKTIEESIRKSLIVAPVTIQSIANANILLLLVERGLIDSRFKLEILELNREFEEARKQLHDQSAVLNFAMPSLDRIHKMFLALKSEIMMSESMRDQLSQVISKIQRSE